MCEVCNTNRANIHITEIVNNAKNEVHLCEECASQKGIMQKVQYSMQNLMVNAVEQKAGKAVKEMQSLRCSNCGLTFQQLRSKVRLGCSHDLEVFKEWMVPFLEKVHDGATSHVGKVPKTASQTAQRENTLLKLKAELEHAIKSEDYEKAAQVRDEIKKVEADLK